MKYYGDFCMSRMGAAVTDQTAVENANTAILYFYNAIKWTDGTRPSFNDVVDQVFTDKETGINYRSEDLPRLGLQVVAYMDAKKGFIFDKTGIGALKTLMEKIANDIPENNIPKFKTFDKYFADSAYTAKINDFQRFVQKVYDTSSAYTNAVTDFAESTMDIAQGAMSISKYLPYLLAGAGLFVGYKLLKNKTDSLGITKNPIRNGQRYWN